METFSSIEWIECFELNAGSFFDTFHIHDRSGIAMNRIIIWESSKTEFTFTLIPSRPRAIDDNDDDSSDNLLSTGDKIGNKHWNRSQSSNYPKSNRCWLNQKIFIFNGECRQLSGGVSSFEFQWGSKSEMKCQHHFIRLLWFMVGTLFVADLEEGNAARLWGPKIFKLFFLILFDS